MTRAVLLSALLALGPLAAAQSWSVTVFEDGIGRSSRTEDSGHNDRDVTSWEGAAGLGIARRMSRHLSLEATLERRRDIVLATYGGRVCGPYHNTCFETHRLAITSTPLTVVAHGFCRPLGNVTPFGSLGIRYVSTPSVHDLTRSDLFGERFDTVVSSRISGESGAGISLRLSRHLELYGEYRRLFRHRAEWDPRRKRIVGLRCSW